MGVTSCVVLLLYRVRQRSSICWVLGLVGEKEGTYNKDGIRELGWDLEVEATSCVVLLLYRIRQRSSICWVPGLVGEGEGTAMASATRVGQ